MKPSSSFEQNVQCHGRTDPQQIMNQHLQSSSSSKSPSTINEAPPIATFVDSKKNDSLSASSTSTKTEDLSQAKTSQDSASTKHYICKFSACDNRCGKNHDDSCGAPRVYRYDNRIYGYRLYRLYGRYKGTCGKCGSDDGDDRYYDCCNDDNYKCTKCQHVYCYNCCFE